MKYLLLLIPIAISHQLYAQENSIPSASATNYISLYPELLGNSYTFSINAEYAHLFNQERNGIYLRGGAGYIYNGLSYLFEGGFLIGKNRNYLEVGIGYTEAIDTRDNDMIGIRAGYRRMGKRGVLLRISPMLAIMKDEFGTEIWPWAGLSLGYSIPLR